MASLADWTPIVTGVLGLAGAVGISRFTFRSRVTSKIKEELGILEKLISVDSTKMGLDARQNLREHIAGLTRQLISESTLMSRAIYYFRVSFAVLIFGGILCYSTIIFPIWGGPAFGPRGTPTTGFILILVGILGSSITLVIATFRSQDAMDDKAGWR